MGGGWSDKWDSNSFKLSPPHYLIMDKLQFSGKNELNMKSN